MNDEQKCIHGICAFLIALCVTLAILFLTAGCVSGANSRASANDSHRVVHESYRAPSNSNFAHDQSIPDTVFFRRAPARSIPDTVFSSRAPARSIPDTVFFSRTIKESSRQRDSGASPPTGGQIFGLWVGKFSAVAVIAVVILCVIAPSTVAMFFLRRLIAWRRAFKETVRGIEAVRAVDTDDRLHDSLKASQSNKTKELVRMSK